MAGRWAWLVVAVVGSALASPNIMFVMVDDWGRFNAGFHGNPLAKTPTMDELVMREGLLLERHYTYRFCSPTRRSFLTGRFPPHSGELNTVAATLDYRMRTIAERLGEAGYHTAHVGKWHGGHFGVGQIPSARGFDVSLGYFNGAETHWTQRDTEDCGTEVTDLWDEDEPAYGKNGTDYGDELYVRRAVEVIQSDLDPLFLYVALQCAHSPMEAPQRLVDSYSDAPAPIEYAMVGVVDEAVANLTRSLKATGRWANSLVVVASDNGGPAFSDQRQATNFPLRGGKYSALEGGVRCNAFVTGGILPPERRGKRTDALIHIADWYATFLGLVGVDARDDSRGVPAVDSVDQWAVISGSASSGDTEDRDVFLASGVLLVDRWKLVAADTGAQNDNVSNNTQWSGPLYPSVPAWGDGAKLSCSERTPCLFDVVDDPSEYVDLASTRPDVVAKLSARLAALMLGVFEGQAATNFTKEDVCEATQRNGGYLTPADYEAPPMKPLAASRRAS